MSLSIIHIIMYYDDSSHLSFAGSKSTIETLEKGVNYVRS